MSERFTTNFAVRLAADISDAETTIVLTSVPTDLEVGAYRFRIGNDPRTSEWLAATYPGAGTTFINAQRGDEGGNPARAWTAGTPVSHTLTGKSFNALSTAVVTVQANLTSYVRPAGLRAYLYDNFT